MQDCSLGRSRERGHYKILYIKGVQAGKDFEELRKQDAVTG